MNSNLNIFISVGEASGDNLGAKLVNALKMKNQNINFHGIAGSKMIETGMNSIFPYHELSIMGFIEIIPKIPKIIYRLYQTINYIKKLKPDILITIDSPGFNFILAKKVRSLNLNIKLIHYVAPTVWAYKPERAKKTANIFDYLIVILPFEQEYFLKESLSTSYIGHPIIEDFSKMNNSIIKNKEKSILLLPGSRIGEIRKLLPIFIQPLNIIENKLENFKIFISSLESLKDEINFIMKNFKYRYEVITNEKEKYTIYPLIDFAICKSGTVSLEIAMARIPMIIAYKINSISAYFLKKIITTKYVNLINIIADEEIIPELLQENCTPQNIASKIINSIDDKYFRDKQIEKYQKIFDILGLNDQITPSEKAADIILRL